MSKHATPKGMRIRTILVASLVLAMAAPML